MAAATSILIFHKAGAVARNLVPRLSPGQALAPDTCKRPPSAHPFSRASASARSAGALCWCPWGWCNAGLVAQLVRARA